MKHIQNFILFGYLLITLLIGCIDYTWHHEWHDVEALDVGNQGPVIARKSVQEQPKKSIMLKF